MKTLKLSVTILFLFTFFSCTKDVDFNQIDDAEINNNLILTFAHFKLTTFNFSDHVDISSISDTIQFPIDSSFEKNLERVEFKIVSNNSFDSDFTINIFFLDSAQNRFYQLESIIVDRNTENHTTIIEIPEEEIHNIFKMEYIEFLVVKEGVNSNLNAELELKSSIELGFNFKNE